MPNHCENNLTVIGPTEEINRFIKTATGLPCMWENEPTSFLVKTPEQIEEEKEEIKPSFFEFHALMPVPEDVRKAGYNAAGYDWCNKHWGTKWGAYDVDYNVEEVGAGESEIFISFNTAWCPPNTSFMEHVGKMFPKLNFELTYAESGCCFSGLMRIINGVLEQDLEGEYGEYDGQIICDECGDYINYTEVKEGEDSLCSACKEVQKKEGL